MLKESLNVTEFKRMENMKNNLLEEGSSKMNALINRKKAKSLEKLKQVMAGNNY